MATRRSDPALSVVEQLRMTLEHARRLTENLEANLPTRNADAAASESVEELKARLAEYESDQRELSSRLIETEHQANRLMNLYVALYQLHATLDPAGVQEAIGDITVNLLGAEEYALLLFEGPHRTSDVSLGCWIGSERLRALCIGPRYAGGDPLVDATLADGTIRFGPVRESDSVLALPLTVEVVPVGAIVVTKMLDHKPLIGPDDRDLIDLLALHAASALYSARVHLATNLRLRMLERSYRNEGAL